MFDPDINESTTVALCAIGRPFFSSTYDAIFNESIKSPIIAVQIQSDKLDIEYH